MGKYDDIINLPHHRSATHPHMSMMARAAQFAPFAALEGHKEDVAESGRLTEPKRELTADQQNELSLSLARAIQNNEDITVTFFVADARKSGGCYDSCRGKINRIDEYVRTLIMDFGLTVPLDDIWSIRIDNEDE